MVEYKIVYTADLHGNVRQYKKLVDYTTYVSPDAVIIGGDLTTKGIPAEKRIKKQREFLEDKLTELLNPIKEKLPSSKIFLIMGNDDCTANEDVLEKENNLYQYIHKKRLELTNGFDIVGYSYVPLTPFTMKDWEKFDLSDVPPKLQREYLCRKKKHKSVGYKSIEQGWLPTIFTQEIEKQDSIQKDLADNIFIKDAKKTVYVIHSPPDKTNLDMVFNGQHRGSMAVRLFIKDAQPYLTLHGHIHETAYVSGSFKHKIGNTLCMSPGNHNRNRKLSLLVFDLYDPNNTERIIL